MKKAICIVMTVLLAAALAGCGKAASGTIEIYTGDGSEQTEAATTGTSQDGQDETTAAGEEESTRAVVTENEKPVTLYYVNYGSSEFQKKSSISVTWDDSDDIGVFGALVSTEDSIAFEKEYIIHQKYWDAVTTSVNYKIGFEISFEVDGQEKIYTILSPADVAASEDLFDGDVDSDEVTGYLGVWMYDDYHQDGSFYTHLTTSDYSSSSLITSIKLRLTSQADKVSNLKLKAFSYSSDSEFGSDGHYAGSYASEISITK